MKIKKSNKKKIFILRRKKKYFDVYISKNISSTYPIYKKKK